MRLYFAGAESRGKYLLDNGVKSALFSYYNMRKSSMIHYSKFTNKFIDSGAFSAFTKNQDISIINYGNFIKQIHQTDSYMLIWMLLRMLN